MLTADAPPGTRPGLLDDRTDWLLLVLALALPILDFSQTSWWIAGERPLGEAQRWLTAAVQAAWLGANASRLAGSCRDHAGFLALAGFAAASAAWSVDPAASASGAVRLLLLGGCILLGQDRHGGRLQATVFRVTCSALLLANLAALALPSRSIMGGTLAGAFRGLTDHKNTLGQLAALTLPFLLAPVACRPRAETRRLLPVVLAALLTLALTRSATSDLIAAVAFTVLAVTATARRTGLPILTGLATATIAGTALLLWAGGALDPFRAVGRDATLTGRSEIWGFVELYVQQRPWLGFGYRAFPLADLLRLDPRWGLESYVVGSTHNAYLAIVTELGYAGLAVYSVWLAGFVATRFPRHDPEARLLAAMVVPVYLVSGLTESVAGLAPELCLAGLLVACHPRA